MKNLIPVTSFPRLPQPRQRLPWIALLALGLLGAATARAQTDLTIYDDALENNWQNWSWAVVDFANPTLPHSGSTAIAVTAAPYTALSLQHDPFDSTGYGNVTFWINGGPTGGQVLNVIATLDHNGLSSGVVIGPLAANTWQQITIPLAALNAAGVPNFTGFWVQEWAGLTQPTFYLDDVVLTGSVPVTPPPPLDGTALYEDAFINGWQNWSWATVNSGNVTPVNSGTSSIAVTSGPFTALRFHHSAFASGMYQTLTFWINGGATGGQMLNLAALLSGSPQTNVPIGPLVANTWQKISVPLADLGVANKPDVTDFWLQESAGVTAPTYYVDDVRLDFAPPPTAVHVAVDAGRGLRRVDPRLFGINTAIWDGSFNTTTTADLLDELDNQALRYPAGSLSDAYHWQTNLTEGNPTPWFTNFDAFAGIARATHAQVYITTNYGSGTPAEAAAWVRASNRTKHYGFKYWEVGNENYGSWELDNNTRPHDPVTYVTRFKDYLAQMKAVDPTIRVGAVIVADEDSFANYSDEVVANPRTGQSHSGWSAVMLATFAKAGVIPDFVIYHRYDQSGGGEGDAFLLNSSQTWTNDAASIRQMLSDYLGKSAGRVEIDCTEHNSVSSGPGKQTTSLVNGLFLADSVGSILQTEFASMVWWDLRNGQETGNNNAASLYGWRKYGDYGLVTYATPAGPADRYPVFYVDKLLQHYARGGERVVAASSDYLGLGAYAVRDPRSGTLNLLLINKHPTATLSAAVTLSGFEAGRRADVYTYGIPQDNAAQSGSGSADVAHTTVNLPRGIFTWAPAPYSVTVIRIPER